MRPLFRSHFRARARFAILASVLGAASLSAQTISFSDTFNPPSGLWSNSTGNWSASGGFYAAQMPNSLPPAASLLPFDLTNYTLTVTVNAEGDSGIYVRTNAAGTKFVLLVIGGSGYGEGTRGGIAGTSLYWVDNTTSSQGTDLIPSLFSPGNTYTLTIKAVGNTFSVYMNGAVTPLTTFTDSVAGSDGFVGLYDDQPNIVTGHGSGAPTTFSNFSVQGTTVALSQPYYFSQLVFSGGYQTTLNYINYSPETITCTTNFYSDSGAPLPVPFSEGTAATRTDILQPGQAIHDQTVANLNAPSSQGWAQATCSGSIQASLLYRFYQSGTPAGQAAVNAETAPTTKFVTFAQTATGVAYANPSTTQSAVITLTVRSTTGTTLGTTNVFLGPLMHGSANLGSLLNLQNFTGFVEITSTVPILSLSLDAQTFPVFSSMPPGDLPSFAVLAP